MKNQKIPLILEIKGNSLDDGPGIRTIIFFKGCPLSCVWCHNPESKSIIKELAYDPKACVQCNNCIKQCSENAIDIKNRNFVDRNKCVHCFTCTDNCPSGALSVVGKEITEDRIIEEIEKDKPFFETSNGGVTLSGGEPTLFMEYTGNLAMLLKNRKINILLETCGFFNFDRFKQLVLPFIDTIYFDIKIFNNNNHITYCGIDNTKIINNFRKLQRIHLQGDTVLLPRIPLIPDITDTKENLTAIAHFLASEQVEKVSLLEYNPLWEAKCNKIGIDYNSKSDGPLNNWMNADHIENCKDIFRQAGLEF